MTREISLFAILLALCGLLAALFFVVTPPEQSVGGPHPEFGTMQIGGDLHRHDATLIYGFLFGILQILFFAGLLVLAIGRRLRTADGRPNGWLALALGFAAYLGVFTLMVRSYAAFVRAGAESDLFLWFPPPSAWMLYGIWTVPAVFIVLFVVRFDSWILTPEDRQRFEELLAARKSAGAP